MRFGMFGLGGLSARSLEVIDEITYLMFIRDLDVQDNKRQRNQIYGMHIQVYLRMK